MAARRRKVTIVTMGRFQVSSYDPDVPYCVISITDPPPATSAKIPNRWGLRKILRLSFFDLDCSANKTLPPSLVAQCMTADDGRKIAEFIHKMPKEASLLVVHCEAGVSRSVATARAISDFDSRFVYPTTTSSFQLRMPNWHVYNTVYAALEEKYPNGKSNISGSSGQVER